VPSRLPATVERDSIICESMLTGQSTALELAERFGVSRSRIYQILSLHAGADTPENVNSDIHLLGLERVRSEMMRIALGPPCLRVASTGTVVIFDGEPLTDNTEKINASLAYLRIDESIRKLKARDKPRRKEMPADQAMKRVQEYLDSLPQANVLTET
jgi:hypothetical protein